MSRPDVDIIIVSTINSYLAAIAVKAMQSGKHVLCEKLMGRNAGGSREMVQAARESNVFLKVGFNH